MKYDICVFFENVSKNFKFYSILTRTTGTLHEGLSTFITISHPVRPRIRNISEKKRKICIEIQNARFIFSKFFQKFLPFVR